MTRVSRFLAAGAAVSLPCIAFLACGSDAETPSPPQVNDGGSAAIDAANPTVPGQDAAPPKDAGPDVLTTPPVKLRVAEIGTAMNNTCARFEDGSVRCWGYNGSGFFEGSDHGRVPGDMGATLPVIEFGAGRTAKQLSMSNEHACVLLDNGSVKCWGLNNFGALGLGDKEHRYKRADLGDALPAVDLGTGRSAKMVSASGDRTCVVLDNDTAKCWGSNSSGALGQGDIVNRGDKPGQMGDALLPINFGTGRTVRSISTGGVTCAILDDGGVKCVGGNSYAALGLGLASNNANVGVSPDQMGDALPYVNLGTGRTAKTISVGFAHVCVILDNDRVKCWGNILSYEDTKQRGFSPADMGDALPYVDLGGPTVKSISSGLSDSCAILSDDTMKCWGFNLSASLGLGDTVHRGDKPQTMGTFLPPVLAGTGLTVKSMKAGPSYSCASFTNGRMKCWGANSTGRLGLETTKGLIGGTPAEMGDNLPFLTLE